MIVKKYILPMFESDEKKDLNKKFNRFSGIGQSGASSKFKFAKNYGDIKNKDSVYGELKLSEKLSEELNKIK